MACVTETGRVLDTSPMRDGKGILELIGGKWVPAKSPVLGDTLFNARVLSSEELRSYIEKSKQIQLRPHI